MIKKLLNFVYTLSGKSDLSEAVVPALAGVTQASGSDQSDSFGKKVTTFLVLYIYLSNDFSNLNAVGITLIVMLALSKIKAM